VDANVVTLRLEGETRTADEEGPRHHGLEMRLLRKATYDLTDERFKTFEMVAVGARWGVTKNNSRRGDVDEGPIALLFSLAGDGPCEWVSPGISQHAVYRPVVSGKWQRDDRLGMSVATRRFLFPAVCTPKELRSPAQGCTRSGLPWVGNKKNHQP
jgi:hypothetical protein